MELLLDPGAAEKLQCLDPKIVEMVNLFIWIHKLRKCCKFGIHQLQKWKAFSKIAEMVVFLDQIVTNFFV